MPAKPKPQKTECVIYARVSSPEQAQGFSVDAQLRMLRAEAAVRGLTIVKEYVEDESAKSKGRKIFGEMLDFLEANPSVEAILEKVDRMSRNYYDMARVEASGSDFHLIKEGIKFSGASGSSDKLMVGIRVVLAKHFIDNLKEEIRKGSREKAAQGYWPTIAPIGYINVTRAGKKIIEQDPVRAPLIRQLFEAYATGAHSIEDLRALAAELGIYGRHNALPSKSTLHRTLSNPVHCGLVVWHGETHAGLHEPIVSMDLFNQVQDALAGRTSNAGSRGKFFSYRGLIKCACCGAAITAEQKEGGRWIYYHCTGARNSKCPGKKPVREELLTAQFSALLQGLRMSSEHVAWLKAELRESLEEERAAVEEMVADLQREEKRLRDRLKKVYADWVEEEIDNGMYRDLKAKLDERLAEIDVRMRSMKRSETSYYEKAERLVDAAHNSAQNFVDGTPNERREMLSLMLSKCVMEAGRLKMELADPFDSLLQANLAEPGTSIRPVWYTARDAFGRAALLAA